MDLRIVLAGFVCFVTASFAAAQGGNGKPEPETAVKKITMAKADKDGNIIEDPESFLETDSPLFCYIDLYRDATVEVRLVVVAVSAEGQRPNSNYITVKYITADGENQVTFNLRPKAKWPKGDYAAEVYVDGAKSGSAAFRIR